MIDNQFNARSTSMPGDKCHEGTPGWVPPSTAPFPSKMNRVAREKEAEQDKQEYEEWQKQNGYDS